MNIENIDIFTNLKSWPFVEAKRIINLYGGLHNFKLPNNKEIIFETGYGPSGLPHIGTFGEVVRTTMVKNAFEKITNHNSKIITFSDDMDGLRKIPDNIPNASMLKNFIGSPLTSIPDPFNKFESFGHHNNEKLKSFLNSFGFKYEFMSSTEMYKSGKFDEQIKIILQNYNEILSIVLPTLRDERKQTYSPFLPICPKTQKVLQVKIEEYNIENNSLVYKDEKSNKLVETSVLKGACKLQWKVDWAMRWLSLGVDYEMCGKDLTDSVILSSSICKVLNKKPPINLIYEMFLDDKGEKISKSKGNGISIEEWLRYSSPESLSLFMFQKPKTAKKLHFDVIPKSADEYANYVLNYYKGENQNKLDNPVWHIHSGDPPKIESNINFNTLINLVNVCNSTDPDVIWGFIKEYDNKLDKDNNTYLHNMVIHAINYFKDFVLPKKNYKKLDEENKKIFIDIKNILKKFDKNSLPEEIQTQIYEIGKKYKFNNLRDYFQLIYEVLLGQKQGPRLGSFISLYGIDKTILLIDKVINQQSNNKTIND